jgi:hypothetical protein
MTDEQLKEHWYKQGMLHSRSRLVTRLSLERLALSTEDADSHVWYSRMEELITEELPEKDILQSAVPVPVIDRIVQENEKMEDALKKIAGGTSRQENPGQIAQRTLREMALTREREKRRRMQTVQSP